MNEFTKRILKSVGFFFGAIVVCALIFTYVANKVDTAFGPIDQKQVSAVMAASEEVNK
ncbi:MAG: hypothetical protein WC797_02385 [Candidatus Paceibacterota bacterium]|jgi:hypothetical protein